MEGMTREQVHAKVDELFDQLTAMNEQSNKRHYTVHRLMLQKANQEDDAIQGCVLIHRESGLAGHSYVTWGIAPYPNVGLHSGHYDLDAAQAIGDWISRVTRGW